MTLFFIVLFEQLDKNVGRPGFGVSEMHGIGKFGTCRVEVRDGGPEIGRQLPRYFYGDHVFVDHGILGGREFYRVLGRLVAPQEA
jgi:hypothetical protein